MTETWLNPNIPDAAIELAGRTVYRADRTADSGKDKGGGVCIYVCNSWCNTTDIVETFCSPDLEFITVKCRPFYLPREFTVVFLTAVYIPPQANAKLALASLHDAIQQLINNHPDGVFIIAGDFNHAKLKTVMPTFHKLIDFPTRGNNILDQVYCNIAKGYKASPSPHLGRSDHISLHLTPAYTPLIVRSKPAVRTVTVWPDGAMDRLQDCFEYTDWDIFKQAANDNNHIDLNTYTSSVLDYITFCMNSVTTQKSILTLPNHKPWMNGAVTGLLKARDAAFHSGDAEAYRTTRSILRKGIREAKHHYTKRIEEHFNSSDSRRVWQGIRTVTGYNSSSSTHAQSPSLPDDLNCFFARFDRTDNSDNMRAQQEPSPPVLTLSPHDVRRTLQHINPKKATGPDGVPGRVLKHCAAELTAVLTDLFNTSLLQASVPTCLKTATIIPVPKQSAIRSLNDYRPVALTPVVMKCFERLVLGHLKNSIPPSLDNHQFAYRANRSTEDAVSLALHSTLTHLDQRDSYVRMLFIDYSSAFNTIPPHKLATKLDHLGLNTHLSSWVLDFLTGRPQTVRMGRQVSSSITLNIGAPQGCVLSPFLFSLYTLDCKPTHEANTMFKFADDTMVVGRISSNNEAAYRTEVENLVSWSRENNLILNAAKTKEMILDFRRKTKPFVHHPITIDGETVEVVQNIRYLGVNISHDLTWTVNTTATAKKGLQRLYFLRCLKRACLPQKLLVSFYRSAIESVLKYCITAWYSGCTIDDRKALQRIIKTAERITGTQLPRLEDIYQTRCTRRVMGILRDSTNPGHCLFTLMPSGRRYRTLPARTTRLQHSFYHGAVTLLNSTPTLLPH